MQQIHYLSSHICCYKIMFSLKKANRCNCWVMEETNPFPALAPSVALTDINAKNLTWSAAIVQHWGLKNPRERRERVQSVLYNIWKDLTSYTGRNLCQAFELSRYFINTGLKTQSFFWHTATFFSQFINSVQTSAIYFSCNSSAR